MQRAAGVLRGRAVRAGFGSRPDSSMAHLTLSPYISWSPCAAGGRSLLPPPFLSSQPTPAERLDFGYRRFYSITVPHVSEIARQRVSLLVSGVQARLSGVRHVRVVSVPPFLLNLQSETFSCDRSIEIQNKMTRAVLFRALGGLV